MNYTDLLIWQYRNKPKARAHAQIVVDLFTDAAKEIISIPELMNIDTATGAALDLCGKRVGQSRVLNDFYPIDYFGFEEVESAQAFNVGKWYRNGNAVKNTVRLNDEDYRFLIKCRITKNFQMGNIASVNNALQFIFSDGVAYDNYDMSLSVIIRSERLSEFKKYVIKNLDILPRPSGVGMGFYLHAKPKSFGFLKGINVAGFNKGKFARIL